MISTQYIISTQYVDDPINNLFITEAVVINHNKEPSKNHPLMDYAKDTNNYHVGKCQGGSADTTYRVLRTS